MSAEEAVLSTIEKSLDEMEPILEAAEKAAGPVVEQAAKSPMGGYIFVAALAGGVSGAVAWHVGKKFIKAKYEAIAEQEIADAKKYYSKMNKKEEFETPEKALMNLREKLPADADEAVRAYQGGDEEEPEEKEDDLNVFLQKTPDYGDWDIEEEMKTRTPDEPYVVSQQEYFEADPEYSQTTLTYYAGDDTLADERDQVIPSIEAVVGEENLERFGDASGDPRIVYIRNERLSSEYEVVKSDGKYAHEVLGFQHSDGGSRGRQQDRRQRKYRGDDV